MATLRFTLVGYQSTVRLADGVRKLAAIANLQTAMLLDITLAITATLLLVFSVPP